MNWKTTNHQQQIVLGRELQGGGYSVLLRQIQRTSPFFMAFNSWEEVVAYMRTQGGDKTDADKILVPVLTAHQQDGNPYWRHILLLMFWPGLRSLHNQKQHWDTDPEELWQNLSLTFLEVVSRLDPAKRQERLAQKIINDTVHRLGDIYRKRWAIAKAEVSYDTEEGELLLGGKDDIDYWGIELRIRQESAIRHLRKYLLAGVINEEEFLLIVGTRIYGKSISDYANDSGLNYELARKRRQRAEAKVRF